MRSLEPTGHASFYVQRRRTFWDEASTISSVSPDIVSGPVGTCRLTLADRAGEAEL
jgi:hypothetical protein